jgi:hypothetical protein
MMKQAECLLQGHFGSVDKTLSFTYILYNKYEELQIGLNLKKAVDATCFFL